MAWWEWLVGQGNGTEIIIYSLLGFAVAVLVVSIIGVFWSELRDKSNKEQDDYEISREINERG